MALSGKRIFVTGAAGFIGSHLVERLVAGGYTTAASMREGRDFAVAGATVLRADLMSFQQTQRVLAAFQPDIIFHLASHPDARESHAQASTAIHSNAGMTLNLLEAARTVGTGLLIYADSSKVYGNCAVPFTASHQPQPLCSYAIGKLAGWELCRMYQRLHDLNVISMRPTLIYGPGQGPNLISGIIAQVDAGVECIPLMGGLQTRDPLYVDDAVSAFVQAAEHAGRLGSQVVNIGGGNEQTVYSLASQIVHACGSNIQVAVQPQGARRNDMLRSFCDNSEAAQWLGWSPRVSFADGLQRTLTSRRKAPTGFPVHVPAAPATAAAVFSGERKSAFLAN